MAGYPAAGYPANSVSGATLIIVYLRGLVELGKAGLELLHASVGHDELGQEGQVGVLATLDRWFK